jgi:short-subunit dehydrogenase
MANARPLALVTGASAGLGAEFARQLAARGYDLALVARRRERLEAVASELCGKHGVQAEPLVADLLEEDGLKIVEDYIARAENLEFLINNAGFGSRQPFLAPDMNDQDAMHRLHIMATLRLTHAALLIMLPRRKGAIVNVSSVAAFAPRPGATSYYATKAWMNCFTEGLYLELKATRSPVRVQALCPGFTLTEFHDVMGVDRKVVPGPLWMRAEDVVAASLRGVERGKLFVVPGWRYKLLVALLRVLPRSLVHAASARNPVRWR